MRQMAILFITSALAGLVACGGGASRQAPAKQLVVQGAFQDGPGMKALRAELTATLLQDGSILLAGGQNQTNETWASAERLDPANGKTWVTGSLGTDREAHAACLLADGQVLICGGYQSHAGSMTVLDKAERYDPSTGTFSAVAVMPRPRFGHKAVLLSDGRVLVAGGSIGTASYEMGTFIYDPLSDSWHSGGNLSATRFNPMILALKDGRVLIAGGTDWIGHVLSTADLFDPSDESVRQTGTMSVPRFGGCGTLLPDGKVLFVGGVPPYFSGASPSAERFDPVTTQFTRTSPPLFLHFNNPAATLPDGRILFTGSWNGNSPSTFSEVYDPALGTFARTGNARFPNAGATAVSTKDGKVLVVGGFPATDRTELFDPNLTTTLP